MSEIGLIRDQYERLTTTTDNVNNSIITFKKLYKLLKGEKNPAFTISKEELVFAKKTISGFMAYLVKLSNENSQPDYSIIPQKVVARFKKDKLDFLKSDKKLKAVERAVNTEEGLDEDQLKLLDSIVTNLDMERSTLFKKLRTARG